MSARAAAWLALGALAACRLSTSVDYTSKTCAPLTDPCGAGWTCVDGLCQPSGTSNGGTASGTGIGAASTGSTSGPGGGTATTAGSSTGSLTTGSASGGGESAGATGTAGGSTSGGASTGGSTTDATGTSTASSSAGAGSSAGGSASVGSSSGGSSSGSSSGGSTGGGTTPGVLLATGEFHTCEIASGNVLCWGANPNGQLGTGDTDTRVVPTPLDTTQPGGSFTAVAAGESFSCAVSGGEVFCWGDNVDDACGQAGQGQFTTPQLVSGVSGATAVCSGNNFACALTSTGAVYCWGSDEYGQMGNGQTGGIVVPPYEVYDAGMTAIGCAGAAACAVTDGGALFCWGANENGQLGTGAAGGTSATPVAASVSGVVSIEGGDSDFCAVTAGGGLYCWGLNSDGQLGLGNAGGNVPTPTLLSFGGSTSVQVSAVSAGAASTCALTSAGVYCWGENTYAQAGSLNEGSSADSPQPVTTAAGATLSGATAISQGGYHACAAMDGGAVCWGVNTAGELGDGTLVQRPFPTPTGSVPAIGANGSNDVFSQIAPGSDYTLAIQGGGAVGWGWNFYGVLGNGTYDSETAPVTAQGLGSGVAQLCAGADHACALLQNSQVWCWGSNDEGQLGVSGGASLIPAMARLPSGTTALGIACGSDHTCAWTTAGTVYCWGDNAAGELGDGNNTDSSTPVQVSNTGMPANVVAVAAGAGDTCAVTSTNELWCWGDDSDGQLGQGGGKGSTVPVQVTTNLGAGVTSVALGDDFACAIAVGGALYCWGYNGFGQVGDGTNTIRDSPVAVKGFAGGATQVIAGLSHTCAAQAVSGTTTYYCWGWNLYGQVGASTSQIQYAAPQPLALPAGTYTLSAGAHQTCALGDSGAAICWGYDGASGLGDGTLTNTSQPVTAQ